MKSIRLTDSTMEFLIIEYTIWKCVFLMITFCIQVECPARREGRGQDKLMGSTLPRGRRMRQERHRKWEDEAEKRKIWEEKAHPCAVLSQNNTRSSQGQCPGAGKRRWWSLGQRSYLQGRIMPNATLFLPAEVDRAAQLLAVCTSFREGIGFSHKPTWRLDGGLCPEAAHSRWWAPTPSPPDWKLLPPYFMVGVGGGLWPLIRLYLCGLENVVKVLTVNIKIIK